ncbi:MAG: alpha-E domain-containing protein [Verrucomicrobiota bacterium]
MLSRVAESIYWMSRYVERAENVARFIGVNLTLMLDSSDREQQWAPLVNTTGDHEDFEKRYKMATEENVLRFLTFDRDNPNSIISCLRAARENARSVREIISSEMWLQLNTFYLKVNDAATRGKGMESPHDFYTSVKLSSHLFMGITDATMTHGEGWHFCRLGRKLERADKTSRILDVKYFILLRSVADVGTPLDDTQWAAVLRSASAFEMYRKKHGRIWPKGIVQFLLLDREFPRAIHFCLREANESLHAISGTPLEQSTSDVEKLLGGLCTYLASTSVDEIINNGLHEYLDHLQDQMNLVGTKVFEMFFAQRVREPEKKPASESLQ